MLNKYHRASARPPSALAGGTATRLSSAMQAPNSSTQRMGTAIGFVDNVSSKKLKFLYESSFFS